MQKLFIFFLILTFGIGSCVFSEETTEHDAKDKLESGFEKTAIGVVEIGVGAWRATQGDVAGAAVATIDGFARIKAGIQDFKESKELFDQARENSHLDISLNTIGGLPDREY